ncbi:hypothetical protein EDD65_102156 [Keratinibaculum paraultunense]|uniref:Uncharacterized protein n=1 Tax=Keratinibaculum paraultunense TaxID=1278232 RepID=A0A4V2UUJ8_9FIRM|nr:hypothetical protein [Keratinibaculum paraultunense]QQY80502.1 hypothetical protein JL105_04155 [Keratinibaculum paraultunense]TCS91224.1 hypothetical protein EDD65_102156 [Keratinibaculum paraultunense]
MKIKKNNIIIILIIILVLIGSILWYGELRTNREVPKRAKYVYNFKIRRDING